MTIAELLDAHTPSLTDKDDGEIERRRYASEIDTADLALRTCSCGTRLDGFYDYVFHLKSIAIVVAIKP